MKLDSLKIAEDFQGFSEQHFSGRQYFACNYGSYATDSFHPSSDIDIFFAAEEVTPEDITAVTSFMIQYHLENGLARDEEVPYENKLMVSYNDVNQAANLAGLDQNGMQIVVPKVIKDASFLSSLKVRFRLLFNALTSPHQFIGRDYQAYSIFKDVAERNLFKLAKALSNGTVDLNLGNLIEALLQSPNGEEGELFLGYKKNKKTIDYLKGVLAKFLKEKELTISK